MYTWLPTTSAGSNCQNMRSGFVTENPSCRNVCLQVSYELNCENKCAAFHTGSFFLMIHITSWAHVMALYTIAPTVFAPRHLFSRTNEEIALHDRHTIFVIFGMNWGHHTIPSSWKNISRTEVFIFLFGWHKDQEPGK